MTSLATVTYLHALRTPPTRRPPADPAWLLAALNTGIIIGLLAPYVDNIAHRIRKACRNG